MCLNYALPHENFVWGVRSEPGVVSAFEKIYDDEDLIVSFDAINFQFPKYVNILIYFHVTALSILMSCQSHRHCSQQAMATPGSRP
jgi:hypothetical protein